MKFEIPTNWTFENTDVAKSFDYHVREQLPWYDLATQSAAHIIRHYLPKDGLIYDIGASTGNIGIAISQTLQDRGAKYVAIESSSEMVQQYRGPNPDLIRLGDAVEMEYQDFDVAVLFLVLMFIKPNKRAPFIDKLLDKCVPGGCLIVVDKINHDGYLGTVLRRLTLAGKVASGCPSDQIICKELSLGGVQVPLSNDFLDHLTKRGACQFFNFGEFSGWVVEKKGV